jgi:hypothetical protein
MRPGGRPLADGRTGLAPLGRNGTWASRPQLEHVAENISRGPEE